ncbi:MAG: M23 family metallopeptidase [Bacteroidota bacterium]
MKNSLNVRLNSYILFFCLFSLKPASEAQTSATVDYYDDYYLFPIQPGVQNTLAGTMGELRSSHFHSGIDIRTGGRTGLAVHAAADGFIARAAVSSTGYGNALYIQHPNGQTTVYAHLDRFIGPISDYVRKEQYRRKRFKLNLYFRKDQFKVQRGDTIALSGNSGSSGGPHLHFDVRDENQRPLNPLKYGFDEIIDRTPPVAETLAVTTMDIDSRVEGEFGRKKYVLKRIGDDYILDKPIRAFGSIGFELFAYDKLDYARFRCGINTINFTIDGKAVFSQQINSFSFGEQRNILRHMNYEVLASSGKRYHKLYIDDGNRLRFYRTNRSKGKVDLWDEGEHKGKIEMIDSYGNTSKITFTLLTSDQNTDKRSSAKYDLRIQNNTLVIQTPKNDSLDFNLYIPEQIQLEPSYADNYNEYYLWDLRNGLPSSIEKGDYCENLNLTDVVPSGVGYNHFSDEVDITFAKSSLFDTLYLATHYVMDSARNLEIFEVGSPKIALRRNIDITLKPKRAYTDLTQAAVFRVNSKNELSSFIGGTWKSGKIDFVTRNFGRFTIAYDSIPPKVQALVVNADQLKFRIEDKLTGLKKFDCYVNDDWVLMNYDYKRKLIWSEKLDEKVPFQGSVKLIVIDNVNNETKFQTNITL